MGSPRALKTAVLLAVFASQSCAISQKRLAYPPADLRDELARRIPQDDVVIPFEITAEHARLAQALVASATEEADRVRIIVDAIMGTRVFRLKYQVGLPGTAEEAFTHGGGDCLALASAFVGLARAVGLDANYMDASFEMQETEYLDDQTTVKVGHITAYVRTDSGRYGLDFGHLGRVSSYQPIDDLEAVAHYYNNLGYTLLEGGGQGGGRAADWAAAEHEFDLATRVKPDFARGWNNLGVARARLGHPVEATEAYRRAIALDREFSSPRLNLGVLLLTQGEVDAAWEQLEAAARLDPSAANAQYELGLARLRRGDRSGAVKALEKAVSLHRGWPAAQAVLDEISSGRATSRAPRRGDEG
ncbi:MAG TPA: tetratricopeptide repeat protein [Anaeromyxobacter sp.]|nr:tetratricopeptide repeat protein [Anaeromyxobacter sp.]